MQKGGHCCPFPPPVYNSDRLRLSCKTLCRKKKKEKKKKKKKKKPTTTTKVTKFVVLCNVGMLAPSQADVVFLSPGADPATLTPRSTILGPCCCLSAGEPHGAAASA